MKRILVLLLVTACGGGAGSPVTSDGVTKADYLKAAEKVCAAANDEQDALKTPTEGKELAAYVAKVVDIATRATDQLKALEAPKADQAELKARVFDKLDDQLTTAHQYSKDVDAATAKNDNLALIKLFSNPPTQTKADLAWMKDYGFDECVDAADTGS